MPQVILRSLFPTRQQFFTAKVNIRDEKDAKVIVQQMNITQAFEVYSGDTKPEKPCWRIRFDAERTSYFIKWNEENGEPVTNIDKQKKLAAEWLSRHDQVKTLFGKPNKNIRGEAMYTLEWEGMRNTSQADLNNKKFEVYEKLLTLTPEEKKDCAFFYGIDASKLKHSELINRLGDFSNGKLMSDVVPEGEQLSPMQHFLTKYGSEVFTDVKMLSAKCLVHNLITRDAKGYWFNQELIGMNKDNIMEYLSANSGVRELLRRELSKKDSTVEDDMKESVKANSAKPSTAKVKEEKKTLEPTEDELHALRQKDIDNEELKQLRAKATDLKIKGAAIFNKKQLLERIAEKEAASKLEGAVKKEPAIIST